MLKVLFDWFPELASATDNPEIEEQVKQQCQSLAYSSNPYLLNLLKSIQFIHYT